MAATIIIQDNKTGQFYKTKKSDMLNEKVNTLPPLFRKLSFKFDNPEQSIIDYFGIDLSCSNKRFWSYNRIPEFNWVSFLLEDYNFDDKEKGITAHSDMMKMWDYARKNGSIIVYVTQRGNISHKPLYGSTIPSFDQIIGIYKREYMSGAPNGLGAYLVTDEEEIRDMMTFYSSYCKK